MINKDTLLFGSFSKNAGNTGCKMFNRIFEYHNIDAIYKSFSVDSIEDAMQSMRTLNIKGVGVSMPYKMEVLKYVDCVSPSARKIGAANTVINDRGLLSAYNTDYLAAKEMLFTEKDTYLYIIGNGGYSKAVQQAAITLDISYEIITRKNWGLLDQIKDSVIYNCTPVEHIEVDDSNVFIDCLINTFTGYKLATIQALHQFKLYTNREVSYENFSSHIS